MFTYVPSPLALRVLRSQISSYPTRCFSRLLKRHPIDTPCAPVATRRAGLSARSASQATPVTSVGATKSIPPRLKALYDELDNLGKEGANYINLSQLQLALRGLESEDPTLRIGVLTVSGNTSAKRLIRTLLADPLGREEEWEKELERLQNDGKGLLIKYGEILKVEDQYSPLTTVSVPSNFLSKQRLEILICETNFRRGTGIDGGLVLQNLLVPNLATPISEDGRVSAVAYPVHKTIVYGAGIDGARGVFNLVQPTTGEVDPRVLGVLDMNWQLDKPLQTTDVVLIDLSEGERALSKIRTSIDGATEYEHNWISSNLSAVGSFLDIKGSPDDSLKPALHNLIVTILDSALVSLDSSSLSQAESQILSTTTIALDKLITSWSESAHTELRDSLAGAFHSHAWARLAWWKLPWRIDDIPLILTELLQRAYLPQAEKGVVFVSGCLFEAKLLPISSTSEASVPTLPSKPDDATHEITRPPQPPKIGRIPTVEQLNAISPPTGDPDAPYATPWPTHLSSSRKSLLATIPGLQLTAQSLLLRFLTTSSLGVAVSGAAYVSVSGTTAYEAGAIASLAFVLAARGVQRGWERARKEWVEKVETEGRRALVTGEVWARQVVDRGVEERKRLEIERMGGVEERAWVRERVGRVRGLLGSLPKGEK